MKTTTFSTLAATLLAATLALPAHAAVFAKAVDSIQKGETETQVLQRLGKPDDAPRWLDGSRSLVYRLRGGEQSYARAYIDIGADGKVLDVQYGSEY